MAFDFSKLRDYIPAELPKLPAWPDLHTSMNPDDDNHVRPYRPQSGGSRKRSRPRDIEMVEDPMPSSQGPKSPLQLVNECDNFPYFQTDTAAFFKRINFYYALHVKEFPDMELGYMLPQVAEVFRGLPDWELDDDERKLILVSGSNEEERSRVMAATTKALQATGHFRVLKGWRDELYPVYGHGGELLFSVERSASPLFGVVTYGSHMTAFVKGKSGADQDMKIWVPRRSQDKETYGGMLDNTVAGGLPTGEDPFECLVREAAEEASLPDDIVRKHAKAAGTVSYFHIRDYRAGGETRLLQPEVQYVFDLELPANVVPRPSDDEVESFDLMTVDEVKEALKNAEFKPNCALVLLDFFIRHGILTSKDHGYLEISSRLHRRLEFPTR